MKPWFGVALVVACIVAAVPSLRAQTQGGGKASGTGQSQPAPGSQNPPASQEPPIPGSRPIRIRFLRTPATFP